MGCRARRRGGSRVAAWTGKLTFQIVEGVDWLHCLEGPVATSDRRLFENAGLHKGRDGLIHGLLAATNQCRRALDRHDRRTGKSFDEELGGRARTDRSETLAPGALELSDALLIGLRVTDRPSCGCGKETDPTVSSLV